jgi:hypothetical protein
VLSHDGGELLTEQVLDVRVERSSSGVRVLSRGRTDAIKAAVWAAREARANVPEVAAIW